MTAQAATVNSSRPRAIVARDTLSGHSVGAVAAGDIIFEGVMTFPGKITGFWAYGATAGTGTGYTVLDCQVNGMSIWADYANAPSCLALDTKAFTAVPPTSGLRDVRVGDLVQIKVKSVSTTGHARLSVAATVEVR